MTEKNEIVIDLRSIKEGAELYRLGAKIKLILFQMFGTSLKEGPAAAGAKIKGTPTQVRAFIGALAGEKLFIDAVRKHGMDDPQTNPSRTALMKKVTDFERETGIIWPFK
jgi:hypothetical protein